MPQRNSGYERKPNDYYPTPDWVTEALFDYVDLKPYNMIWEPACGDGAMQRVIQRLCPGKLVFGSDIEFDFLARSEKAWQVPCIITNPPYSHAEAFVHQALCLTRDHDGMVAMLLSNEFDTAKGRSYLFANKRFAKKIVLTQRIMWFEPKPGEKRKSPTSNHAWYVWDWKNEKRSPDYIHHYS